MVEYYTVIDHRPLSFEGYFRPQDLFQVIRKFLKERGYFPLEYKNFEEVFEQGRQITIELRPFHQISDYVKKEMVLRINMYRLKEETIEIDGVKRRYQHGKVSFVCDAHLITDLKAKWEGSGFLYFLRVLNDKFIRKDWINTARTEVGKDMEDLLHEVSSYLNMIRFKTEPQEHYDNLPH